MRTVRPALLLVPLLLVGSLSACRKESSRDSRDPAVTQGSGVERVSEQTTDAALAKPGMVFIPAGQLQLGTPSDMSPRVAEEEAPGTMVDIGAFYIDKYPYPNEPGAIVTANVTRDDAERLCQAKKKRLCTEVEWERACKGPDNTMYEYGGTYSAKTCGTGGSLGSKYTPHPTGEHPQCKSSFGVMDMHGGAWEWTSSMWARSEPESNFGVLRGGNATAGELVGRCANALARPISTHLPNVGFRCCSGTRTEVSITVPKNTNPMRFQRIADTEEHAARFRGVTTNLWGSTATDASEYEFSRMWFWRPVANEELIVALGCERRGGPWARCGGIVVREVNEKAALLAQFSTGNRIADVPEPKEEAHKLNVRAVDVRGTFGRQLGYLFGRITMTEESRP
jgi:formylglycine-generating enzyme